MNDSRKYIIKGLILFITLVFTIRLFVLQIVNDDYAKKAEHNIIQRSIEYPFRGLIYDRNGKLLVYNTPEFDIRVTPKEVSIQDTSYLLEVFNITMEEFLDKMEQAISFSKVKSSIFLKQLSLEEFSKIQDHLIDFKGFDVTARTGRAYSYPAIANAFGYVSEISRAQLERDSSKYYQQGDYLGQSGLEAYYEKFLRGKRGVSYKIKNVSGEEKGRFQDGKLDTLAVEGMDLQSTIDIDLQMYGKYLMEGKSGSIVAIEPSTGELLALVSGPSYDPSLLTGRHYGENFYAIARDSLKPLFNRPLMAQYRPGSIFKIIQAMIGLQEEAITINTRITCNRNLIGCHGAHSYEDLEGAITHSCNPYFFNVMKRVVNKGVSSDTYEDTKLGLNVWRKHVSSFGFGKPLGVDLPSEKGGLIPDPNYYDRAYRGRPWKYSNIFSIAIGEGENLVVPIQMANLASIIANRGFYYVPHLVKKIGEDGGPLPLYLEKQYTSINSEYFEVAVEAMHRVVEEGTGRRAKIPGLEVCGKTGTVQNDPLPDHSVFIAFAPKENPKIAISVYVEDSGQGGRAAASIASLMIEKYLFGATSRPYIEDYALNGKFIY
ncbi:MAG: penicillin-binding transpeptidase domain-containing protein [Cyclobacteriaceae bacterium]|nr:penicillin-binding transpeptidase domain-containing protein [Cyclobacteriaceae bacterium]